MAGHDEFWKVEMLRYVSRIEDAVSAMRTNVEKEVYCMLEGNVARVCEDSRSMMQLTQEAKDKEVISRG